MKQWLQFSINGTLDTATLSEEKFDLNIIKISTNYLQCQKANRICLKKSPDADINYLHQATVQESIQVDQYKDRSDMTKSARAKQMERFQTIYSIKSTPWKGCGLSVMSNSESYG